MSMAFPLIGGLFLINLLALVAFRVDKSQAIDGGWRLPERTLLAFAFFGGWFGAKLGQQAFRHKTRKQPFALLLNLIPLVWAGAAVLFYLSA